MWLEGKKSQVGSWVKGKVEGVEIIRMARLRARAVRFCVFDLHEQSRDSLFRGTSSRARKAQHRHDARAY